MIYGWISPDGAVYDCEFMAHYDLACEFVDAYKYKTYLTIVAGLPMKFLFVMVGLNAIPLCLIVIISDCIVPRDLLIFRRKF